MKTVAAGVLLAVVMMTAGLSPAIACEDHEAMIKGKQTSSPLPPPNSN